MKLISLKQLRKKSKKSLINFYLKMEAKALSKMPKEKLCALCYKANKSLLPRLRKTNPKPMTLKEAIEFKHKGIEKYHQIHDLNPYLPKRKTKRKKLTGAAKRKFLARMNKGRRKKGLKPIRSK